MDCKIPQATLVNDEVELDYDNMVSLSINDKLSLSTFVKIVMNSIRSKFRRRKNLDARLTVVLVKKVIVFVPCKKVK